MTTQLISIINRSKHIKDADLVKIFQAVSIQLAQHVAPIWGKVPAMECIVGGAEPTAGASPCYLEDVPDVDGALGYHDEGDDGVTYIKVFVEPTLSNGGTLYTGPNSVSVTLSHELCELIGDGPANIWADGPNGVDFAYELSDAVEGDAYDVNIDGEAIAVSNFLYPDFFDGRAQSGARLDYLAKLSRPFTMTDGGYQIQRTEPGRVSQVFASHDPHFVDHHGDGVVAVFGPKFPRWKRALKVRRAMARAAQTRATRGLAETPPEGTRAFVMTDAAPEIVPPAPFPPASSTSTKRRRP